MTPRVVGLVLAGVLAAGVFAHAQEPDPHADTSGYRAPVTRLRADDATARQAGHVTQDSRHQPDEASSSDLPAFIAPVTAEMREAAFPQVHGHAAHDTRVNAFVLFDGVEWRSGRGQDGVSWRNTGWVGGDIHRFWFRSEGDAGDGSLRHAQVHALYGVAVARWWDAVVGVRQDVQPGAATWLAFGIQGLAPGFFHVEATGYIGSEARTAAHVEVSYDLLLTNRLVLQPTAELTLHGRDHDTLGVARGFSSGEAGLRLRYHVTREVAPYVGVTWVRAIGAGDTGHGAATPPRDVRWAPGLVTGVRVWF